MTAPTNDTAAAPESGRTVTLSGGHTATLRDVGTVTNGERKRLLEGFDTTRSDLMQNIEGTERVVALMVESWTLDRPVPSVDRAVLDDLSIPDADALLAAVSEASRPLFPQSAQ